MLVYTDKATLRVIRRLGGDVEAAGILSNSSWAVATGEVCDMVQVPAYLCRQTSILKAAASTKKPILLKKGQFMSPWNMKNSVRKIESYKNHQILWCLWWTNYKINFL